ncbi:hypothetical protein [Nocardioides sp. NPDC006273]|uniref:hypothetical protein n=1 Tax=Nocardioides sp. NPDC006273 TaxID=3155598 RepID=UPI0033A7CBC6
MPTTETLLTVAGICGAALVMAGFFAAFWRLFKRLETLTEGIMGKPAVTDYANEVVEKAVPSLQARVGKIEELLVIAADTSERLMSLETWRVEHEEFSQELVRRLLDMKQTTD